MRLMLLGNHGPFAFGSALRAAVWTPAQLPSLVLWLDAEDSASITLNGSTVAQWSDKSGGNRHFTQVTAAFQPTYLPSGFNNRPAIENVSDDFLELSSSILGRNVGGLTCAIVGSHELGASFTATGYDFFIGSGAGATRFLMTPSVGSNLYAIGGRRLDTDTYGAVSSSTDALANRGNPWIRIGQRAYSDGVVNHWTDGKQDMTNAVIGTQGAGNTSDTDSNTSRVFQGTAGTAAGTKMTEVIVTHSTMSNEDRQKLEGYLAWKWGGDALWTPAQLSQVQAWWDASDESTVTLNVDRVAALADKSPNNFDLTQTNAADQPVYDTSNTVAPLPMLQQNSIDSLQSTTTSIFRNTSDAYVFSVGYYPTTTDSSGNAMLVFVSSGASGASTRMGLTAYPSGGANALSIAGRRLDTDGYLVIPSSTTRASIQDTLFMEVARRNYATDETYHWTNGTLDLNGVAFGGQGAGNTSDTDPLLVSLLAPSSSLTTFPDTRVGEVVICNQTLAEEDRQRVEGYLAHKWGLVADLPASHPYKYQAPRA